MKRYSIPLLVVIFLLASLFSIKTADADNLFSVYGILDSGLSYQKNSSSADGYVPSGSHAGVASGGQSTDRIGFKGSEDLGHGAQLNFVLENGFNIGNGTSAQSNRAFGRQSWLGLQTQSLGYVRFGRQTNFAYDYLSELTPFSGGDFTRAKMGSSFAAGGTERLSNTIKFETISMSGLKLGLGYSFAAELGSVYKSLNGDFSFTQGDTKAYNYEAVNNLRALTTGAQYKNGPLYLTLTGDVLMPNVGTANGDYRNITSWTMGGYYDFNAVKVALTYGQIKNGWINPLQPLADLLPNTSLDIKNGFVIFDENVELNSYTLAITAAMSENSSIFSDLRIVQPSDRMREHSTINSTLQTSLSLGYTYKFSKTLNLYAYGSYTNGYATIDGLRSMALGLGLRKIF